MQSKKARPALITFYFLWASACAGPSLNIVTLPGPADRVPLPMPQADTNQRTIRPLTTEVKEADETSLPEIAEQSDSKTGTHETVTPTVRVTNPNPSPMPTLKATASPVKTETPPAHVTLAPTKVPTVLATPTQTPTAKPTPIKDTSTIEKPSEAGVYPFYQKRIWVRGIPVLSSAAVDDRALLEVRRLMLLMSKTRPILLDRLVGKTRIAVIGKNELLTDIPEYKDLYTQFPGVDWNARARGLGATTFIPVSSAGEENLLCMANDRYRGESIFVHEFGHTLLDLSGDSAFIERIQAAYNNAHSKGLWSNTYADTNYLEYWAESVQDYFDTNAVAVPSNGIHNGVHTRIGLQNADGAAFQLLNEFFANAPDRVGCP